MLGLSDCGGGFFSGVWGGGCLSFSGGVGIFSFVGGDGRSPGAGKGGNEGVVNLVISIKGFGGIRVRDAEVVFEAALPGREGRMNEASGASSESSEEERESSSESLSRARAFSRARSDSVQLVARSEECECHDTYQITGAREVLSTLEGKHVWLLHWAALQMWIGLHARDSIRWSYPPSETATTVHCLTATPSDSTQSATA